MWKVIISFFFICSCSKYYEVQKEKGLHVVKDVSSEIEMVKEVEWKIGRKKEEIASMGIRFSFTIPKISEKGRTILQKKYNVNSWLYRVSRIRRGQKTTLGYFYYPFSGMTKSTRTYTANLYYHAASVSKRFRLFHCPAFKHRYKMGEMKTLKRSRMGKSHIYLRNTEKIPAKVSRIQINPIIFSVGRSIVGEYIVDYAFYDSNSKTRFSNWHKVDKKIAVDQEYAKSVPSCVGIVEELNPLPESRLPNIRDLEIR